MSSVILRRETIIALRARHTAFRIAIDILHPQLPPPMPMPPQPVTLSREEMARAQAKLSLQLRREAKLERERARKMWIQIAFILAATVGFIAYVAYSDQNQRPSPPPQARPILPAAE